MTPVTIPFQKEHQIVESDGSPQVSLSYQPGDECTNSYKLGQPTNLDTERNLLSGSSKEFWISELCPQELDDVAPYLWCLSTQSSANITPLHHQAIKGREVVITESPRLHLVWAHRSVFIKPIPEPLLSHQFWIDLEALARQDTSYRDVQRCALGYLRTYFYLLRHKSDLRVALEKQLVPTNTSWAAIQPLLAELGRIDDGDVSPRYQYGELRLVRLNWYAPLLFRRWNYEALHWEYADYFAKFYGPFLFVFGVLSTALSALQVGLAVEQLAPTSWDWAVPFCRGVGAAVFLVVILVLVILISMYAWQVADEWVFALRVRYGKKRRDLGVSS